MAIVVNKKPSSSQEPTQEQPILPVLASKDDPAELPLVALREGIIFPHTETVLVFGRAVSKLAIEAAEKTHGYVIVVGQKKGEKEAVSSKDLYQLGTLAKIERTLLHENETHVLMRGIERVQVTEFIQTSPFFIVNAKKVAEKVEKTDEFKAKLNLLTNTFKKTIQAGKPVEFFNFMRLVSGDRSHELVDHIASTLDISTEEKQKILATLDVNARLEKVQEHLSHEHRILDIEQNLMKKTKKKIDERMRENILRERLQVIQKELGEDEEEEELASLEEQIDKAKLPKKVEERLRKELRRLSQMSPMHSEYAYIHTWIETTLALPWSKSSRERSSLKRAASILDKQHYGLEKVKKRILEHLAVLQLRHKTEEKKKEADSRRAPLSTILCFVGPPGVGKTSIGRSIAEALGREFVKVSLGGVHDEAEIRGHRRTYVGAMPGRIMQAMAQAKTKNPVFVLDEIDKVGNDFRGDPSAALLEALDPEQNHEFIDHYIDLPFDLSEVMFITTANVVHTIPDALRDRLEIVEYSGYTAEEKFHIAKDYLIRQVQEATGLKPKQFSVSENAIKGIIESYTREAGVRSLKRELSKIARQLAWKIASNEAPSPLVKRTDLDELLGPPKVLDTIQENKAEIGLVNGLAWTSVGGELLPIEASMAAGKGQLTLTGQLGKVMQESAQAAFTYVRSQAKTFDLKPEIFEKNQMHVHVPEGAVPKDGPSAGVAMATVIASALTGRPVRHDIAMTGEITLRGRVLGIGGLKEKLIAARRGKIKTVFIPKQNVKDLVEVPDSVKKELEIISVEWANEVLEKVLVKSASKKSSSKKNN